MRSLYAFAAASLLLFSSGCATILHGEHQNVPIDTTPDGATVLVNGIERGTTPTILSLKRGKEHRVVLQLDGYEDVTIPLEKNLAFGSAVVGNFFSWGLFGFAIDFVNGAAYELSPDQLQATLDAQGVSLAPSDDPDAIRIVLLPVEAVEAATAE